MVSNEPMSYTVSVPRCLLPSARAFAVLFPAQGEPNGYKTVYQSDPISGICLFTTQANELALAPGLFNIPFGAYEEARLRYRKAGRSVESHLVSLDGGGGSPWGTFYLVKDGTAYEMGSSVEVDGEPASYGWEKCQPG